jgi:hypothetical protein
MRASAVLVAALMLACGSAAAAPPRKAAPRLDPPMQVHLVRSAHPDCEPQCPQWIAAQGRIVAGTARRFREVLSKVGDRKLPVLIDSGGGAVNDALSIGRLIRARGLQVAVTRTTYTPCAPTEAACRKAKTGGELRGLAEAQSSKCASSCAFILAGGTQRLVGSGTGVGVHQISMTLHRYTVRTHRSFGAKVETRKTLVSVRTVQQGHVETQRTYAKIRQYLSEMGIGEDVMSLILSTPNSGIHWLTPTELQATGLATHFIDGEELVTGVPASPPALASPPSAVSTAPELMRYESICEKIGSCEKGLSATDPRFDLPGYLPKPPSAAPSEQSASERGDSASQ